jgi:predicted ATPase
MLTALTVRDFKSYRKATLPLAELTVLIGANASGKSNLLEALQLLSWIAKGRRFSELLYALKERQLELRGSIKRLTFQEEESVFSIGGSIATGSDEEIEVELSLAVLDDGLHLFDERAAQITKGSSEGVETLLYELELFTDENNMESGVLRVGYNTFHEGEEEPNVIACTDQQAAFTQLTTPARFARDHKKAQELIPQAARQIQSALESILFLDPIPRRMRDYSFIVEHTLQGDGSTVSAVLHDLCERQLRKAEVLSFVRALPEQDILDLTFLKGPREEVMVQLKESFGGKARTYEAALLSDGTLRVLAIAAALLSSAEGSLVVIEEIDNGVHPTRAKLLLDNIQRVARERKLRVLLTTHNPALLDAIPLDAIPDVVACYRDPTNGDSRLMPLSKLQDYPELVAQGPVGQLVTRGILERYLKFPKSSEDKAAQAEKVLELLQVPPSES